MTMLENSKNVAMDASGVSEFRSILPLNCRPYCVSADADAFLSSCTKQLHNPVIRNQVTFPHFSGSEAIFFASLLHKAERCQRKVSCRVDCTWHSETMRCCFEVKLSLCCGQ